MSARIEIWDESPPPPEARSIYPFETMVVGQVFRVSGLSKWDYLRQRASKLKAEGRGEWTVMKDGRGVRVYRIG